MWNTDVENEQGFFTTSLSWNNATRAYDPWVRDTQEPLRKPSFESTTYDNVGDQFSHLNRSGGILRLRLWPNWLTSNALRLMIHESRSIMWQRFQSRCEFTNKAIVKTLHITKHEWWEFRNGCKNLLTLTPCLDVCIFLFFLHRRATAPPLRCNN